MHRSPQPQLTAGDRDRLPIVSLFAANLISLFGGSLTFVVIPWFVLQTTGSASRAGLVAIAMTVPTMVVGLFGGIIVDRFGAKRTSIVSDVLSGITTALIPLLHHTVGLEFWQLLLLVMLGAFFDMPGYTARASLLPDLALVGRVRLEQANAAAQTCRRITQVIGPPTAGVLIALFGTSSVLWIDALTFFVSAGMIALLIPDIRHTKEQAEHARPSVREDVLTGLRYIRADRLILALMVTFALGSLLAEPFYGLVLPVYANEVLGSAVDLGLTYSALALGAVCGNVYFGVVGYRFSRRWVLITGWVVRALSLWVFVTLPGLWTIAILLAVNGFLFEPTNAIFSTIMQERVPAEMRGRVFGAFETFSFGTVPLGLLAYSLLIEGIGLHSTLVVLAVLNVIPVISLIRPSTWRELGTIRRQPLGAEPSIAD